MPSLKQSLLRRVTKVYFPCYCGTADALVSTGLAELGYNYVNIGIPLGSIQGLLPLGTSSFFKKNKIKFLSLVCCFMLASSDDCWSNVKRGKKVPGIISAFNPWFSKFSVNLHLDTCA